MKRKKGDRGRGREEEDRRGRTGARVWCGRRGLVISGLNISLRVFLARGCLRARQLVCMPWFSSHWNRETAGHPHPFFPGVF